MVEMLKNILVETDISHDQVDWLNLLEKELSQIYEDLSFYNNIIGEFIAEDIILLGIDSKSNII